MSGDKMSSYPGKLHFMFKLQKNTVAENENKYESLYLLKKIMPKIGFQISLALLEITSSSYSLNTFNNISLYLFNMVLIKQR